MAAIALEDFWREHVEALEARGGSQRDYCREYGIHPRELRRWRTRFYGPKRAPRLQQEAVGLTAGEQSGEEQNNQSSDPGVREIALLSGWEIQVEVDFRPNISLRILAVVKPLA